MLAPMNSKTVVIRELVEVRPHPTVVRLDDLEKPDTAWLTDSFVLTPDVRKHFEALKNLFRRDAGCGVFLIGHYGSGKSHFLAYLIQKLRARALTADAPQSVAISLVNYSADNRLEAIIGQALGIETSSGDRRAAWKQGFERFPGGLVLVIDELSEFLRSKPDIRAFTEDVRILQFMGEWAQDRRFWVVAAMQEAIEHTGELEHSLYRKIKDRYPLRLLLTPAHVQSLIAESILIKKPGYDAAVDRLANDLHAAYPNTAIDFGVLRSIYPLHPATLSLLEEVRDRFSQARGVVDFTVTRLRGDPARRIAPFLDQPWGALLTPDVIVDHFRDLFEIQPEFLALAQQVLPWYQKHLHELFDKPALQTLAERLLNLLVLVHLSPAREALSVDEAAGWLLYSAIRTDPSKNLEIVRRVLDTLAREGRYVTQKGNRCRLESRDDGRAALDRLLEQTMQELRGQDELILEILAPLLPAEGVNPFLLPRNRWQQRRLLWRFHERRYGIWFGEEPPSSLPEIAFCIRPPWGVVEAAGDAYTVIPPRLTVTDEWLELAALLRLGEQPVGPDVIKRIGKRIEKRTPWFQQAMRSVWSEANLITPDGKQEPMPPVDKESSLAGWLDSIALLVLRRRYPAFERFAPGHGPLPREAWLRFMRFAVEDDIGRYDADEYVKLIREAYLLPMGLMRRQGRDYTAAPNLEKLELVRLLMPVLEHNPSPETIHRHLAEPIYGLVPDQVKALLLFLYLQGEIDIRKDEHSYRGCFESLPNPLQYDTVELAHALNTKQLQALERLCEGLGIRTPKQWTVLAQRRMVERICETGRKQTDQLHLLVLKLKSGNQGEQLIHALEGHIEIWRTLDKSDNLLQGFERFFHATGSIDGFLEQVRRLGELPERIPRLVGELQRLQHLLQHPAICESNDPEVRETIDRLGSAPDLERIEDLEAWLHQARQIYSDYKTAYQRRHDAWWQAQENHPIWQWQPPAVANSRHLGLSSLISELEACRKEAAALRCGHLVNLDYQPLCTCGFRGGSAPIAQIFDRFDAFRARFDEAMVQFFQQDSIKSKIQEWHRAGFELPEQTLAYLEGSNPLPEIGDVELFDRSLAGLDEVQQIELSRITELLQKKVWEPDALAKEIQALPGRRLRFTGGSVQEAQELQEEVALWCAQQCLRHAVPLPQRLHHGLLKQISAALRPEWTTPKSIENLDRLGLDDEGQQKILSWLIDGHIPLPGAIADGRSLCSAVAQLLHSSQPATPEALSQLCEGLYRHHRLLYNVAGRRWLERLETLARTPLADLPPLTEILQQHADAQWLILDCAGLPLFDSVKTTLELTLAGWRLHQHRFAQVSPNTTTDGCYRELLNNGLNHFFEKIDVIDQMIHNRTLRFPELTELAATELKLALQRTRPRLDPNRPLLVFSDHGFRLAADGAGYEHGGPSTLERTVPIFLLEPL
jgi:Family of unknown function (DUF6079)